MGGGDHFEKVILKLNFDAFTRINPKVLTTRCDKRQFQQSMDGHSLYLSVNNFIDIIIS